MVITFIIKPLTNRKRRRDAARSILMNVGRPPNMSLTSMPPLPPPFQAHQGINPHAAQPISPAALGRSLWRNRQLIVQLTRREVLGRYQGSFLGLAWSLFTPLLMLAVYTFIFSVVFKARWGEGTDNGSTGFAVVLFVGMVVHGLFAEAVNRAPGLILSNANFVKKVVFPLEVLPVIAMCASLFHAAVSLGVLLAAHLLLNGFIHGTAVFIPFVLFPLILVSTGLAWILASLGVFLRDVGQTVGLLTTVMMFLAPVFYPLSAVPEPFRSLMLLNPLTFIIEQARNSLVWGSMPDWEGLAIYALVSACTLWAGFAWFQKTRKGFADVI